MRCCHDPLHCFLPPYILERLAESSDPVLRRIALRAIEASSEARAVRTVLARMPAAAAFPSSVRRKHRLVYDMRNGPPSDLPGRCVRSEGEKAVKDRTVNEAYNGSGHVFDFFWRNFDRNSLDGKGMSLISSVHVGNKYNNAFWNGEQMAFGDGDGVIFRRFTRSLDVIGHELAHGVVTFTANLEYRGQSGALNEHFADVFGVLVRQWRRRKTAARADWTVGRDIMGPKVKARGLRTFTAQKAFEGDPLLGTDPQPKHMKDLYTGTADRGGVHINSGIPNHAFYLSAKKAGGRAWEGVGRVWYETLLRLKQTADFEAAAAATVQVASEIFPRRKKLQRAVTAGWRAVGIKTG